MRDVTESHGAEARSRLDGAQFVKPKLKVVTRLGGAPSGPAAASDEPADPVEKILAKIGEIAVLPQIAHQVIEATEDEDASIDLLERTISVDPGLTARLLAQVNSAFYALPKKTTSIREAVMFLGLKGVRAIVLAVGVFEMFLGKTDQDSLRRRAWWRHSLDTAVFCRCAASSIEGVEPYEAYTCGLLHLLGKTFLDRYSPQEYARVQTVVDQGAPDVLAERAVFQCDHITLIKAAATQWGFPEVLVTGLDYFSPTREDSEGNRLKACTALGSRVVGILRKRNAVCEIELSLMPGWIVETLELTENEFRSLVRAGIEEVSATQAFGI